MRNIFSLEGRTALVTGGGRGLGWFMARALAGAGAKVLICGRDTKMLATAAAAISTETGGSVSHLGIDLSNRRAIGPFMEEVGRAFGAVDIFVGNAGGERQTFVDSATGEDLDAIFETNVVANILLSTMLSAGMKSRGWGRIVYLSSIAASRGSTDGHGIYSASKGALEAYMRAAAVELGARGVTVNCIAPGTFLTDLAQSRLNDYGPVAGQAAYDAFVQMAALNRWGHPEELEGPILLLASDAGSYITGQVLHVDGGQSVRMRP
jgi:NAD(P)-dependent dehydrogenase (short-subunit alcohol dehydrogenase family)